MDSTAAGIASLQTRARVVRLALWGFLAVTALTIVSQSFLLARQMQWADPALSTLRMLAHSSFLFWIVMLLATVPILLWVHRAHTNLVEGRVNDLAYSPGWAVGSYFVPFANCVVPFRAMRELYNRSHGEPADFAQSSAGPVTSWWACHIPAVFLNVMLGFMVVVVPLVSNMWFTTPPAATTGMSIFTQILWLGSAWFLLQTVNRITAAQAYGVATANVFD